MKMAKSNREKKNWLNLDEKVITTFVLVMKTTKSNREKKNWFILN